MISLLLIGTNLIFSQEGDSYPFKLYDYETLNTSFIDMFSKSNTPYLYKGETKSSGLLLKVDNKLKKQKKGKELSLIKGHFIIYQRYNDNDIFHPIIMSFEDYKKRAIRQKAKDQFTKEVVKKRKRNTNTGYGSRSLTLLSRDIAGTNIALNIDGNISISGQVIFENKDLVNLNSNDSKSWDLEINQTQRFNVEGTDFFETHLAFNKAVERARRGKGPSLIQSDVVRLLPHSSSDDQRKYRSKDELQADLQRDPLMNFTNTCIEAGISKEEDFASIKAQVKEQVDIDAEWAENQQDPNPHNKMKHVFVQSNNVVQSELLTNAGDNIVLVDAINHALDEELAHNDLMMIYGQDVAGGKGGVFTATRGLTDKFGEDRVFNAPLAESSIIGTAIGFATLGFKPVVENSSPGGRRKVYAHTRPSTLTVEGGSKIYWCFSLKLSKQRDVLKPFLTGCVFQRCQPKTNHK